jgi:hypothetical protein
MPNPKKRLVLHIGTGKTGTSAIQNLFKAHQSQFRDRGVFYPAPETMAIDGADLESSGNGGPLFSFLYPPIRTKPLDETAFLDNFAGLFEGDDRAIFISNEMLEYGEAEKFAKLRDFCAERGVDLELVYALRDIASHAFSAWSQVVVYHDCADDWLSFQKHYCNHVNRFALSARKIAGVVARDKLHVLNYSKLKRAVVAKILDILELEAPKDDSDREVNNSSSPQIVALMLEFNKTIAGHLAATSNRAAIRGAFYSLMNAFATAAPPRERMTISQEEYKVFEDYLGSDVRLINERFLGDQPIAIAREHEIGQSMALPTLSEDGKAAVAEVVRELVRHDGRVRELDPEMIASVKRAVGAIAAPA